MDGVFLNQSNSNQTETGVDCARLSLLAQCEHMEVMLQSISAGDIVWIVPAEDENAAEFFFIHAGEIELNIQGEMKRLGPGQSFYVTGLKQEFELKSRVDTQLLYITNRPMFDSVFGFQEDLTKLLLQINEKDHYTYRHSCNVMRYTVKLYERLKDHCAGVSYNDIVVASLFHDVGKCYVPDEILKKAGRLTVDEYRVIARHPIDSGRLLRARFGEQVANIAQNHHERLDGSGYPFGLTGNEIGLAEKIVAVADAFDAMTTNRGYNMVKTPQAAAEELCALGETFDSEVASALLALVQEGAIQPDESEAGGELS